MPKYQVKREQLYVASFFHEIWKLNWYLVWCADRKRIQDFIKVNHNGHSDEIRLPSGAASIYLINSDVQIIPVISLPFKWKATPENLSSLTHEAVHAAIALQRIRNIPLPSAKDPFDNDEESFCYLVQWIMYNCLDSLSNQNNHKFKFADELVEK